MKRMILDESDDVLGSEHAINFRLPPQA